MSARNAPCGWDPDAPCPTGPCCPDTSDPLIAQQAKDLAAAILWRATGMRFGCCEVTVRPCKPETKCSERSLTEIIYWDQRDTGADNLGVLGYTPTLIDGSVFNIACGCVQGCCTCKSDCEVFLPGPVCAVTEVQIDGAVVDPANYSLYDHHKLVFLAGQDCPPCQNYNLPPGEVGTWSVTYTIGTPVPDELNYAAGVYACELAKALVGQDCALPKNVASATRRGVEVAFADPWQLIQDGYVGIPVVDTIIRLLNPSRLASRTLVWSPDLPVIRRMV